MPSLIEKIEKIKKEHPEAVIAVHQKCRSEVLKEVDFIGSTAAILDFASQIEV